MESPLNGGIAHSVVSVQANEKTETWMALKQISSIRWTSNVKENLTQILTKCNSIIMI